MSQYCIKMKYNVLNIFVIIIMCFTDFNAIKVMKSNLKPISVLHKYYTHR